jgi:hypothetical protein
MIIEIEVTQDCIDRGKPRESCECPIALACEAAGFQRPDITFDGESAILEWSDEYMGRPDASGLGLMVCLPADASQFMFDFDDGKPVKPFKFSVETDHAFFTVGEEDEAAES